MAELATIARPYAEALFKASLSDLSTAANWVDELGVIAQKCAVAAVCR
jgi:F-type H+-transporting ATPase subunit delta